jgi:arsenate reductase-like glutaredoxin family protein
VQAAADTAGTTEDRRHTRTSPHRSCHSSIRTLQTTPPIRHYSTLQPSCSKHYLERFVYPYPSRNSLTKCYPQHGAKNVVTLFHKPSNQASTRILTLLKQANAQSDQAERTEFELDITEAPPTADQLKNILDYLGGGSAAGKVISGAENETDAMRRLKADGEAFHRPCVVDWNQGKAGKLNWG